MQNRKIDETDADYIARLETSNAGLKAQNTKLRNAHKRFYTILIPAAQKAGLILAYAAEMTRMSEDPEVHACAKALYLLGTAAWTDDVFVVPDLPLITMPAEPFHGDVEMILHSGLEKAKSAYDVMGIPRTLVPEIARLDPETVDWDALFADVSQAIENLNFCRSLLRLDERSAVYDHCFETILEAIRTASLKSPTDESKVPVPWGDSDEA